MNKQARDVGTAYKVRRNKDIAKLEDKAMAAQLTLEKLCDNTSPHREKTIVFLGDPQDTAILLVVNLLRESGLSISFIHNETDLFVEIGKNSILGLVVQVSILKEGQATKETLRKRNLPVYCIFSEKADRSEEWCSCFKSNYSLPAESGRLITNIMLSVKEVR